MNMLIGIIVGLLLGFGFFVITTATVKRNSIAAQPTITEDKHTVRVAVDAKEAHEELSLLEERLGRIMEKIVTINHHVMDGRYRHTEEAQRLINKAEHVEGAVKGTGYAG